MAEPEGRASQPLPRIKFVSWGGHASKGQFGEKKRRRRGDLIGKGALAVADYVADTEKACQALRVGGLRVLLLLLRVCTTPPCTALRVWLRVGGGCFQECTFGDAVKESTRESASEAGANVCRRNTVCEDKNGVESLKLQLLEVLPAGVLPLVVLHLCATGRLSRVRKLARIGTGRHRRGGGGGGGGGEPRG
jgi:hypothetical protein